MSEKQTIKIGVNEIGEDKNKDPEVKEYLDAVKKLMDKCQDKQIPLICFTLDPETAVSIICAAGDAVDLVLLISQTMERIPGFSDILSAAIGFNEHKKAEDTLQHFTFNPNPAGGN